MSTTIHSALRDNKRRALAGIAIFLGLIAYVGGLLYAGVRSFDLFAKSIPADLLPLAVVGVLVLEVNAIALPLALHFWTAPGAQRISALSFYILDLTLIAGNAVLDAAHNAGTILPTFIEAYGTYGLPVLPILGMATWAVLWALDPSSREHDMTAAVRAATHEAFLAQIAEEAKAVDITLEVQRAAAEHARAVVRETLGAGRRPALLSSTSPDAESASNDEQVQPVPVAKRARNGVVPKG